MARVTETQRIRERLEKERGTIRKGGGLRVALVYPSPYRVGMSSLGFQSIYRVINRDSDHTAERAFLPDDLSETGALLTYESLAAVGDADVIAFSLAYELELTGIIDCLQRAGLAPLAANRSETDPLVIIGGPLTFSNPTPAGPFADVVIMGEGEQAILEVLETVSTARKREALLEELASWHGVWVPSLHGEDLPAVLKADDHLLPAYSQIITPDTELSNMHLVEAERGCHRRCTFCVMRRSTNGGMRTASARDVLATIPEYATRVGLVGAAVTDHPKLIDIVRGIVESGRGLGISSLRADRLKPELVELLKAGGYRTLTVACDGASERLRGVLQKSIKAHHLRHSAELCRQFKIRTFKVYMMLGVPEEVDGDMDELIELITKLSAITPMAMTVSPFVAKRNTPLVGLPFAGIDVVERRIKTLRKGLKGRCEIRSASAKWAWVEYCLAQGGFEMGHAVMRAHAAGGRFANWKSAIAERSPGLMNQLRAKGRPSGSPRASRSQKPDT